jgi:hypothetical protein
MELKSPKGFKYQILWPKSQYQSQYQGHCAIHQECVQSVLYASHRKLTRTVDVAYLFESVFKLKGRLKFSLPNRSCSDCFGQLSKIHILWKLLTSSLGRKYSARCQQCNLSQRRTRLTSFPVRMIGSPILLNELINIRFYGC